MVRIRLRRVGAKHQPSYRIVVAEKESPRDGRFLEIIGHYNPRTEPATIVVDEDRLYHWLSNGAQPSDSLLQVLKSRGSWDRWLRFKQGEDLQKLLAEAESSQTKVDPRTRRDDLLEQQQSKKAASPAVSQPEEPVKAEAAGPAPEPAAEPTPEPAAEPTPEPAAEPEVVEPAEEESETEPEADADTEVEAEPEAEAEAEAETEADAKEETEE
jgi:small subunit ribosomal protein S16